MGSSTSSRCQQDGGTKISPNEIRDRALVLSSPKQSERHSTSLCSFDVLVLFSFGQCGEHHAVLTAVESLKAWPWLLGDAKVEEQSPGRYLMALPPRDWSLAGQLGQLTR